MRNYLLRRSEKNVIDEAYLPLSMGGELWLGNPGKMLQEENTNKRASVKLFRVHVTEMCLLLPNTEFNKGWLGCCLECLKQCFTKCGQKTTKFSSVQGV